MAQRDQIITWRGEERQFSPDFRFLRGLDARLQSDKHRPTNILQVANVMANGGNEYLDIPIVWAAFLQEAGFEDATEDDCWQIVSAVHSMAATPDQKGDYVSFYLVLAQAIAPAIDLGKQRDPQETPAPSRIETNEATSGA